MAWAEMSREDKRNYMSEAVMPRMAELFEEYDSERFAGFSCDGCHGEDMRSREFAMPNPGILALSATGTPEQQQMVQEHPEMVRFMFNRVLPTMQQLLGAPDYDEATGDGFTCFACHTRAGSSETAVEN